MFNLKISINLSKLILMLSISALPAHAELSGLKDPTVRPGGPVPVKTVTKKIRVKHKQAKPLKLEAIFFHADADKNRVLMNGRLAAVGDSIAGAKVVSINHGSIKVRYRGQEKILTAFRPDIKKRLK